MRSKIAKSFFRRIGEFLTPFFTISKYIDSIATHIYTGYKLSGIERAGKNIVINPSVKKIENGGGIMIGDDCIFGKGLWLSAINNYGKQTFSPEIKIGKHCIFGQYNHIGCINRISIGNNLLTGSYVLIEDHQHGNNTDIDIPPVMRNLYSKGPIEIGNNVWIGDRVTVLAGVCVGDNVIIGANSVVTHNIPDRAVVAGVPAKVIKIL